MSTVFIAVALFVAAGVIWLAWQTAQSQRRSVEVD